MNQFVSSEKIHPNKATLPIEVQEELGNYVYRLIDPRNGETFYVGKGKGNRIYAHIHEGCFYLTRNMRAGIMGQIQHFQRLAGLILFCPKLFHFDEPGPRLSRLVYKFHISLPHARLPPLMDRRGSHHAFGQLAVF